MYFGDETRQHPRERVQQERANQRLLLCGLDAVNAIMEAYNLPGFDKADFDVVNLQVQEDEEEVAYDCPSAPVTALQSKGNYNIEVLERALRYRDVSTQRGDHTKLDLVDTAESLIAGNGSHWNAFVRREGRWWHIQKVYVAPVLNIKRQLRAALESSGMFLVLRRTGGNSDSTQHLLLEVAAAGTSAADPIMVDNEVVLPGAGSSNEVTVVTAAESVGDIEGAGDPLAVDAPAGKKSRSDWHDKMVGKTLVLVNSANSRYKCSVPGCPFESELERGVTVHVARHRMRLRTDEAQSQDLLSPTLGCSEDEH